jgi:hypothetical protein
LEVLIEDDNGNLEKQQRIKEKIKNTPDNRMSKKDRKKLLQPIEEELRKFRWRIQYLEDLRESKIPFW